MTDDYTRTVRIVRPKVSTDERGHTVWTDPVETAELELVTTGMLQRVLESGDEASQKDLRQAARGKDGVLARDPAEGRFQIINDDDLRSPADVTDTDGVVLEPLSSLADIDGDQLSLVSTQALRRVIKTRDDEPTSNDVGADNGFDPYNRS